MSGKTGFILSAAAAVTMLAFAGATSAQDAGSGQKPAQQQEPSGQQILEKTCQGCHDLRPIQTSAKDAKGWTTTIAAMVDNGAEISEKEIPVLVRHLVLNNGPVPDGPGKQILLNTCTMCHDLGRIKTARRSAEEWEETLISMLNEGAPISEEQFPVIHDYLSKHFNVKE
jgi:cytochrome c5